MKAPVWLGSHVDAANRRNESKRNCSLSLANRMNIRCEEFSPLRKLILPPKCISLDITIGCVEPGPKYTRVAIFFFGCLVWMSCCANFIAPSVSFLQVAAQLAQYCMVVQYVSTMPRGGLEAKAGDKATSLDIRAEAEG